MDPRERANDRTESLLALLDGRQADIWTAMPGIVQSFDAVKMTCVVVIAIQPKQLAPDGTSSDITIRPLLDCPAWFPAGGGCHLTFPVKAGDECLVVLASRCIDNWWQNGGVQPQAELRMHNLSDGFALLGSRSQPKVVSGGVSTTATELRTDTGLTYVRITPGGELITLGSPNEITINAPGIKLNGYLHSTAAVIAGFGGDDQVGLQTHDHSAVKTGTDVSGPPVPGS